MIHVQASVAVERRFTFGKDLLKLKRAKFGTTESFEVLVFLQRK